MDLLQAVVNGALIGGVYAVTSIGLTLVFGVMEIVNFAHAAFLMLGMYIAYHAWAAWGIDPLFGSLIALVVVFVLGAVLQRTLIMPILRAPQVSQIFLTVGLLLALENTALLAFGSEFRSVQTPYQTSALRIGGIFVSVPYLAAFLMSVASGAALSLFLRRTDVGRAMRATAQNPTAARLVGIDVTRMYWIAFGLGTGLTAFGGAVILPYMTVFPTVGGQFVVLMFTVVVLGGLGSIPGAMIGGLVVGVIQSVSALLFPIHLQNLVLFLVFIAVLAVRPTGLLGAGR
ncbi:MAG TPA: branched-chain amino acid ABC transporter permease [Thermodesulfobacteriota bacterium]